jgi:hypothetical protein
MTPKFFHQATYGNMGGVHTMKPILMQKGDHIYATAAHPTLAHTAGPVYNVSGGLVYKTSFHPEGKSGHAEYEIRGDKVFTTPHHTAHNPTQHVFELKSHE